MDRNLALEFVRVTEAGAIAAAKWMGRGDQKAADRAAVNEMRARLNQIDFSGRIVIGEGEKDKAPQLYNGEIVGKKDKPTMDLAVDPLECTDSVAWGRYNAISVIAAGPKGSLLSAPDTYMEKIAVGTSAAKIDLNKSVEENLKIVSETLSKKINEITVMVLDRPRHEKLIKEIRKTGARVRLITDGDIAGAIATCLPESGIDVLMGIGGSAEAVLSAVALKVFGGEIICRFKPKNSEDEKEIKRYLKKINIKDINHIFSSNDLAKTNELIFTATGIIDGPILDGVVFQKDRIITNSIVIRGISGTIRYITTHHNINKNKKFSNKKINF